MFSHRSAGILLHLTSLPGGHGIGTLGESAHRFVEFLAAAGQSYWQLLPLGPTDECPYAAQSSWAGAPFLVDLELLERAGDLTRDEVEGARQPEGSVDFGWVRQKKFPLLRRAASRFLERNRRGESEALESFAAKEGHWLENYALFAAIKRHYQGAPWWLWEAPVALRSPEGLARARKELASEIAIERYLQMRFFEQWDALRATSVAHGVKLLGDVPIYCSRDSSDVWCSRQLFKLDSEGRPLAVSGVPPDYFSVDGQRWGSPVYDWEANRLEGYAFWIARLRGLLRMVDLVRIDHFRAFEAYWEIPNDAPTARKGKWVEGPGDAFFTAAERAFGSKEGMPFIAEDLGLITQGVHQLRDRWGLSGMRVLQFAFAEGAGSPHLPFHYVPQSVVYTGTHDNDTSVGWYEKASEQEKDLFRRLTASDGSSPAWHLMRLAYGSVARLAIVPMQDVLALGSEARMNVPGQAEGNWRWRLSSEALSPDVSATLRGMAELFGRVA